MSSTPNNTHVNEQMFRNYNFVVVPNLSSKIALFRKKLYKSNGAHVCYSLKSANRDLKTVFVLEDSGGTPIDKLTILKSFRLKVETDDELVLKYPILQREWVTKCLELKKLILPFDSFQAQIAALSVDENMTEPFRIIKKLDSKRTSKRQADKEQLDTQQDDLGFKKLKKLNQDDANDDLSELEQEHSNHKNLASSQRQLLLLNSNPNTSRNDSPNLLVIDYFNEMAEEYKKNGESFKYVNYKKAVNTLSGLDHQLTDYHEAIKLPNIGKRLAEKIEQINATGQLKQLQVLQDDPKLKVLQTFTSIYGVGPLIAKQWYDQGLRSVKEVSKLSTLTLSQRLGIKYYKDWNVKIPRDEVTEHVKLIQDQLLKIDPSLEIMCTGSYRRGLKECGDIDFLLMKKNCNDEKELSSLLFELILSLQSPDINYIQCLLVHLVPKMRKFYGGGKLSKSKICRRVDILSVPWQVRGSTLIYFTGNDILNRSMRQLAADKGLHLNDKGLFKNFDSQNPELIESFDEKKIFEALGVTYKEPQDRNIGSFHELHWN